MRSLPSISALTAGISLSACTQAFTKKPMKPSFTPCFLSNSSLYWLRRCITAPMSTSLKVVSMAAVLCASLSRRAMVWRNRVIFTRSSRAASSDGGGGLSDRSRGGSGTLDRRHHVALGHTAVLPGARNGRRVDAGFRRQPAHRRRNPRVVWRLRRGLRTQPRLLFRGVDGRGRVGLLVRPPCRRRRDLAGRAFAFLDLPEQRADGDRLAVLSRDVAEHARGRRRHLDGHLIGLELDERLVDRNRITRFLEPFADCCLGHGFAESGHADVSHGAIIPCGRAGRWKTTEDAEPTTDERKCLVRCGPSCVLHYPSAASNSALSCLRCNGIWPTAVAAAAARPA